MRAATRRHGQPIGHYLIAYAHRKPWDVKLKAVGELARGVKTLKSFFYGPSWSSHEGGMPARSTVWYNNPAMWRAHAELAREIGAAEDLLVPAMPAPAEVALLYSTASDAWTINGNLAYGFDRMHTWLALAHAQVPVDILSERDAAEGRLSAYKVCYLSGPNLTRAAAEKLADWVRAGGTLWVTAGAAAHDEYNRPLDTLDDLLPVRRSPAEDVQQQHGSGRTIDHLKSLDEVTAVGAGAGEGARLDVVSVRQALDPRPGAEMLGHFKDGKPALVRGSAGRGTVYAAGFLPALSYIKPALAARALLEERLGGTTAAAAGAAKGDDAQAREMLERSYNPWEFPADVRDVLLRPVRSAGVTPPPSSATTRSSTPSPWTPAPACWSPLANYTLRPIPKLSLTVRAPRPVTRVLSSRLGPLEFRTVGSSGDGSRNQVEVTLPLEATDFLQFQYADAPPAK